MEHKVYVDFQDGDGFRDITNLVKYDTLTINSHAFSDNWHYAQSSASLDIIYDPIIYDKFRNITKEAILRIIKMGDASLTTEALQNITTEDGFYLLAEGLDAIPVFYGRVPPTKSRKYNGILNNTIFSIEALDELKLLDKESQDFCYRNYYLMNPNDKAHSVVHQLAYMAGFTDAQIGDVFILQQIDAVYPPSPGDKIIDILDMVLFEHGYTLNMDVGGRIYPLKWMRDATYTAEFNNDNIIKEVSIKDSVRSYEGAEVIYYELGEVSTTTGGKDILLYMDDNLPIEGGTFPGYPIPANTYYPPKTNVIDETTGQLQIVYQDYDDSAVKYWTNKAIVNKLDYNYKAFGSDYSAIIATRDLRLEWSAEAGINVDISNFYNRRAQIRLRNTTGAFKKLYYLNIYGKVLYKTSERTSVIKNTTDAKKLDTYVSTYVSTKERADLLCRYLASQAKIGYTIYTFDSAVDEAEGQLARIVLGDGTSQYGMIMNRTYNEYSGLFSYTVRAYDPNASGAPGLTEQTVVTIPSVPGKIIQNDIVNYVPEAARNTNRYWGKFLDSAPTGTLVVGDVYCRYSALSGPTNRGIFSWDGNAWVRTEATTEVNKALMDISFLIAYKDLNGVNIYGTAADYSGDSSVQANFAFFQSAIVGYLQATDINIAPGGRIYSGYSADGNTPPVSGAGFWLGSNGTLKAKDVSVAGTFTGNINSDNLIPNVSSGPYVLQPSSTLQNDTNVTSWVRLLSRKVYCNGTANISFGLCLGSTGYGTIAYGRIYKNGVPFGSIQSESVNANIANPTIFTQSLSVSYGDLIEIYGYSSNGLSRTYVSRLNLAISNDAPIVINNSVGVAYI